MGEPGFWDRPEDSQKTIGELKTARRVVTGFDGPAKGAADGSPATSVSLKRAEGASDTVLRGDIEKMRSTGLSLMPEGLEKQLDQQAMADLIAYVMSVK